MGRLGFQSPLKACWVVLGQLLSLSLIHFRGLLSGYNGVWWWGTRFVVPMFLVGEQGINKTCVCHLNTFQWMNKTYSAVHVLDFSPGRDGALPLSWNNALFQNRPVYIYTKCYEVWRVEKTCLFFFLMNECYILGPVCIVCFYNLLLMITRQHTLLFNRKIVFNCPTACKVTTKQRTA